MEHPKDKEERERFDKMMQTKGHFTKRTGPSGNPLAPIFTKHDDKKKAMAGKMGKEEKPKSWVEQYHRKVNKAYFDRRFEKNKNK